MTESKAHIIARLQREILPLQGLKTAAMAGGFDAGLGQVKHAFPNATFPLAAIHEFICPTIESIGASFGFIAAIAATIMKSGGVTICITDKNSFFPPALTQFNIRPEQVIFVEATKENDRLWAIEEALKCNGLAAVIAQTKEISFTASRRLQLAVEKSGVTGFIIRHNPKNMATACVCRWQVKHLTSLQQDDMPGVGFARWQVELTKVRNGSPGIWQLQWVAGKFVHETRVAAIHKVYHSKTG